MKPLGRKPKSHNFEDNHPQKGYKNWWDDICNANKRGEKQNSKRLIRKDIDNA